MQFKLRVIQGALKRPDGRNLGAEIPISGRCFAIGTAPDCQMRCSGHSISPYHCMILVEDDRVVVRDDSSQGGTFVNGVRIHTTACLFHGDRLRVGKLEFDVVMSTASPPAVAAPPVVLPRSQRDTVAATDTVADLVVDLLQNADEAEREHRRFDPAAREFRPTTEAVPTAVTEPPAKANPRIKRPPTKLPAPPPVRGEDTVDAAQQALAQLLTPATRKKPG